MDQPINIKIAVDFDGTIVETQLSGDREGETFAFRTLKELQKKGAQLIL